MKIISADNKELYKLGTFNKTNNGYSFHLKINPSLGTMIFFTMSWTGAGNDMILEIPEAGKIYFIGQVGSSGDQGYIMLPTFSDVLTFNILNALNPGPALTENWSMTVFQAKNPTMLDSYSNSFTQVFPPGPPSFVQMAVWSSDPNISFDRIYFRERTGQPCIVSGFNYFVYKGYHSDFNYHIQQVIPISSAIPAWGTLEIQFDQGLYKINGTPYGFGVEFPVWLQVYWNAGGAYPAWIINRRSHLVRTGIN